MKTLFTLLTLVILSQGCIQEDLKNNFEVIEVETPCQKGGEPNLFVAENGDIYLSWLEHENDTTFTFLYSIFQNNKWTSPKTIGQGNDWFVNWADFPSLVAYGENGEYLAAHWLQMSADGTYDYNVKISISEDGGQNWNLPFTPHTDGISAEHGFVSMIPVGKRHVFATWLDGRNTKTDALDHESHGSGGPMTLRSAVFDLSGDLFEEKELDDRVCDCCQTSAAQTRKGMIVAYRNRSSEEVRDIGVVRQANGKWMKPKIVYADNWKIAGCPVNGPSIKALGDFVALAWFGMKDDQPEVKVTFSVDAGETFMTPVRVDEGNPLGRVDVLLLNDEEALVSWMESGEDKTRIMSAVVNRHGDILKKMTITEVSASRRSGFPVMAKNGAEVMLAWTEVSKGHTTVKTSILKGI